MLVGDVEVPHEHPSQDSRKSFLSIDFYALSDETYRLKQITGNKVKLAIFNMAAMKNLPKNEKFEFP